jgi:hypothetical protein
MDGRLEGLPDDVNGHGRQYAPPDQLVAAS